VANNTREDGRAFLEEAARIGLHTEVQVYPFRHVSEALGDLKRGLRGAAVISFT
jgi:alcohol dehydrogenase, propanol-preferring